MQLPVCQGVRMKAMEMLVKLPRSLGGGAVIGWC